MQCRTENKKSIDARSGSLSSRFDSINAKIVFVLPQGLYTYVELAIKGYYCNYVEINTYFKGEVKFVQEYLVY